MLVEVFSDGSCCNDGTRHNPMGAGGAVKVDGVTVLEYCNPCGFGTSPKAEWEAFGRMARILDSGKVGVNLSECDVVFKSDNEMLVNQVKGLAGHERFKVQWVKYMRHFYAVKNRAKSCRIVWVPRVQNTIADALATRGRAGEELCRLCGCM